MNLYIKSLSATDITNIKNNLTDDMFVLFLSDIPNSGYPYLGFVPDTSIDPNELILLNIVASNLGAVDTNSHYLAFSSSIHTVDFSGDGTEIFNFQIGWYSMNSNASSASEMFAFMSNDYITVNEPNANQTALNNYYTTYSWLSNFLSATPFSQPTQAEKFLAIANSIRGLGNSTAPIVANDFATTISGMGEEQSNTFGDGLTLTFTPTSGKVLTKATASCPNNGKYKIEQFANNMDSYLLQAVLSPSTYIDKIYYYNGTTTAKYTQFRYYRLIQNADESFGYVQMLTPTGELAITENGTVDVSQYATANVNVAGAGGLPIKVATEAEMTAILADTTNVGKIYLYTGTTTTGYVQNGLYQCVSTEPVIKIYGVSGEAPSNSILTRTDDAVGLTYTVGTSEIQSDFDSCYPWSDMVEWQDTLGNKFIKIPKFYTQYTIVDGLKTTRICQQQPDSSWKLNPIFTDGNGNELDYFYIGKYNAGINGTKLTSLEGTSPLVYQTRATFRTYAKNNGTGYQQLDIWAVTAIQDLFKIEFATVNSQSIMAGNTNGRAVIVSGQTDSVATASGSPTSNTSGAYAMKYRGIENFYGNVSQWVDGININNYQDYVCYNPTNYADDIETNYTTIGYTNSVTSVYIQTLGYDVNNPFVATPVAVSASASASTYYADYYSGSSGWRVASFGGSYGDVSNAGAWFWSLVCASSRADRYFGGRLLYRPIGA